MERTKQDRHLWNVKAGFTKAIFVANCLGKRFFLFGGYKKAVVRGTKQDRHLWEVKADFTKAIFVANCLGKRFFLV
ncbi:hypothetical protein AV940_05755 [Alteromonas sp. Mac2]|nr:hypothetical protein AV939_05910 [Alteromonas sp. Mac1]AMJ90016.1 hypothetical protein AV940_05755 [Alteromonas sp. Mac2]ANB22555.1 hypothetical protein A6K25_15540 [Alteromonas stellipolaris]